MIFSVLASGGIGITVVSNELENNYIKESESILLKDRQHQRWILKLMLGGAAVAQEV